MARPIKDGLSYFPFDVDFFSDIKIKSIRAHYGADGIALYLYVLCEIYRSGYYVKVNDDFIDCAAADLGISTDKTRQLLKFFCRRSLFDDTLFTADTILTAKSVQRRFQEARRGSKRDISVDKKSWLLDDSETLGFIRVHPLSGNSEKNESFSEKNPDNSEKNDIKERKGKESKEKESMAAAPPASPPSIKQALIDVYGEDNVSRYEHKFDDWVARKGGNVRASKYDTIKKWMEQDGVKKPQSCSSFDTDDVTQRLMARYKGGQ